MNIRELRIGNYIQLYRHAEDSYKSIHKIKGIFFEDTLNDYAVELEDGFIVGAKGFRDIPLTEDILLKCGLGKSDFDNEFIDNVTLKDLVILYNTEYKTLIIETSNHDIELTHIHSLHQLQNLYFALTGEELNVEL